MIKSKWVSIPVPHAVKVIKILRGLDTITDPVSKDDIEHEIAVLKKHIQYVEGDF